MPHVYVTRIIPDEGMALLSGLDVGRWESEDEAVPPAVLEREAKNCDGILTMLTDRITEQFLDAAGPRLQIVSNMAVGYDNIDVAACTARRIAVGHTPGVLTEATADLTFGLILAVSRRISEGERLLRDGGWRSWSPLFMAGRDVHGATLGIVGLGRIGLAVARRARGFDMNILFCSPEELPASETMGARRRTLAQLLAESDIVSLHVPLDKTTVGLIGAAELALMKPTAYLINVSRGRVVDEAALAHALATGTIAGAALDVMEREPLPAGHPLLSLPNLILTPHIGSATVQARTAMARLAAENLARCVQGRLPPSLVNPEVWPDCLAR